LIIYVEDWRKGGQNTEILLYLNNLLLLISLALSKHLADHIDSTS